MPATTKSRKKIPATVERDMKPFPFMAPNYPVKPWIDAATAVRFMTVSFRQDDGSFAAFIAEDESVWAVGKTRREAEEAAKALYAAAAKEKNAVDPECDEDDDLRVSEQRMKGSFVNWRAIRHKYAK